MLAYTKLLSKQIKMMKINPSSNYRQSVRILHLRYARIDNIIAKAVIPNPIGLNMISICKNDISNAKV